MAQLFHYNERSSCPFQQGFYSIPEKWLTHSLQELTIHTNINCYLSLLSAKNKQENIVSQYLQIQTYRSNENWVSDSDWCEEEKLLKKVSKKDLKLIQTPRNYSQTPSILFYSALTSCNVNVVNTEKPLSFLSSSYWWIGFGIFLSGRAPPQQ